MVSGYSEVETRVAARVLRNYDDYDLQGTEFIVTGTKDSPKISKPSSPTTSDSEESNAATPVTIDTTPKTVTTQKVVVQKKPEQGKNCNQNNLLVPVGTRTGTQYCSEDGVFRSMKESSSIFKNR